MPVLLLGNPSAVCLTSYWEERQAAQKNRQDNLLRLRRVDCAIYGMKKGDFFIL